MRRFVVISCGKKKRARRSAAREIYTGPHFRAQRAFAEALGETYVILSAKHGVLDPETEIDPYDVSISDLSRTERDAWGRRAARAIRERLEPGQTVVVTAGKGYRDAIRLYLERGGALPLEPIRTLGMGRQMKWLRDRADRAP